MGQYEYIEDYGGYSIWQDMDDGYFVAYDDDDKQVAREGTLKLVKEVLDDDYFKKLYCTT